MLTDWLQRHMLPCAFKFIFGVDCPGCGFQRSFIALVKGDLVTSFTLYPATIPILIAAVVSLLDVKYQFDKRYRIKNKLYVFMLSVVFISYVNKMVLLYIIH